jgi:hypothetical protein
MRKVTRWGFWIIVALAVLIQLVPIDRSNPPVTGEVSAPDAVMEVLRSSCYDCHSNETLWPWYSRVAPVSWLLLDHVLEGREYLNFSDWQGLSPADREEAMQKIWEEVEAGAMPLPIYLRMHPEAEMTDSQRDALRRWTEGREPEFPDWN